MPEHAHESFPSSPLGPSPRVPAAGADVSPVDQSAVVRVGQFFFRARNYLFPITFLLLLLTTKPDPYHHNEVLDWWLDLMGIVVACIGQGYRTLAIGCVDNIRRGGKQKHVAAHALICHGPYAHSRNPLYVGNLLIILGLGLIANNRWWYFCVLPSLIGIYWTIVVAEEAFLTQRFGHEYTTYCQSVNRFVPRLAGLRRSLSACAFDWKRVLRKEYGIFCSWASMAIGLLVWERWELYGYAARKLQIQALLLLWLGLLVAYSSLSWLKTHGKLRSEVS